MGCEHYPDYDDVHVVNFGALPPIPEGWCVAWHECIEMYMGHGPNDWESPICWNRFWVRQWVIDKATEGE